MILDKNDNQQSTAERWVTGDIFGLDIPADAPALIDAGADFLTNAFRAAGTLGADNSVVGLGEAEEFVGGGTGKKLLLSVTYDKPAAGLPERLFIKFSRNFDNELWDRARFMMISEAHFAVLSREPGFPVAVPTCLFADVEAQSGTGLIISECIAYGHDGIETAYAKCMDYAVPDPLAHYTVILKNLARLAAAHKCGQLPPAFDQRFPFNPEQTRAMLAIRAPQDKLVARAERMFDFIDRHPQLFPDSVRTPGLRARFIADIPAVLEAESLMVERLLGNPDLIAFCHWNANIDNCWFWRDAQNALQCGFIDWANAGPISLAQALSGAISGAEPVIWDRHLDDLVAVFVDEFAARGGPPLDTDELRQQCLFILIISGVAYAMNAPIAIEREIGDVSAAQSYRDAVFREHDNARIQLHMMTKLLHVWQTRELGDWLRGLRQDSR